MIDRYNPNARYKDRAKQRFNAFITSIVMLIISIGLGYWLGRETVAASMNAQTQQISIMEQELSDLRGELTGARTEAQTAVMRHKQLKGEMEEIVPSEGPLRSLLELVKERLKEGTSPERLSFVIRSARPPRNCKDPDTKRFVVSTPTYQGPDGAISVDNGMVTITAQGTSARNQENRPEAWFDPGQPVKVQFKKLSGEIESKQGTLPINFSMVVKDKEYRFSLSSGARSFMKVTYDSCDYP